MSAPSPHVLLILSPGAFAAERDAPEPRWAAAAGPRWPWPLLAESARLRGRALVSVIDAAALKLDAEATLELAWHLRPDRIFGLAGWPTCSEEPAFFLRLRERMPAATLVLGGPAVTFDPSAALERYEAADGIVLQAGSAGPGYERGPGAPGALWRGGPRDLEPPVEAGPCALPPPQLELFPWPRYREGGWKGGLVGAALLALPSAEGPPMWRTAASFSAELEAWRRAGARALSLRGAALPLDAPAQLDGLLQALAAVGLPWTADLGPALPTADQRAALRRAGARRLCLGVRLDDDDQNVLVDDVRRSVGALRAALGGPGAPALALRVDGLNSPDAVRRALALADRLGAPHLDLRPDGASVPDPSLLDALRLARRRAALRPIRWAASVAATLTTPRGGAADR